MAICIPQIAKAKIQVLITVMIRPCMKCKLLWFSRISMVHYQQTLQSLFFVASITGPPLLRDKYVVRIEESNENVPVDLSLDPAVFPEPSDFSWNVNSQPLTNLPLSYSSVNFSTIRRSHAGNYSVFAANYLLNDPSVQIGNDTGSFYLDVLCMQLLQVCITSK